MGETLRRRIKQARFASEHEEALLNVIVASNYIREESERVVTEFGVTLPQYNVLRILRGVHPEGHPRSEISARMLDRAPDVTRIIDRLERKKLVCRDRSSADRRHSITRITAEGLQLLEQMDDPFAAAFGALQRKMSSEDARQLSTICEQLYG